LFGQRLDRQIIQAEWANVQQLVEALRHRIVTPSLILRKLTGFRQQNGLAIALREIGRVCRTLFTLRWFNEPALRSLVTAELNKGEARNSLARAVAFHRLGRFRERHHDNQQIRAASLTLLTAAIALFNCRYLQRALTAMRADGLCVDPTLIGRLSPLGWEHINLSGDYVWSDNLPLDDQGFLPLRPSHT
jgi:TnpA family transposase